MNKYALRRSPLFLALILYCPILVFAGDLTPNTNPSATGYSLDAIYQRLSTNAITSLGTHALNPVSTPNSTFHTLSEIYDLIPTILSASVLSGTEYLGVAGTYDVSELSNDVIKKDISWGVNSGSVGLLTPNGGSASTSDLFSGATAHLNNDWVLDTGELTLACNSSTFNGIDNLVSDDYDGGGDGTNRWCMSDSGDALAGDILSGKIAWVNGQALTGNISTNTLSAGSETVSTGYYTSTTLSSVDTDLDSSNIVSGVTIFGFGGSAIVASGTAIALNVLSGATFSNNSANNIFGTMPNIGQQVIDPTTTDQTITAGYHDGTGYCAGDVSLSPENIKEGETIFGVAGVYGADIPTCSFVGTAGDVWVKHVSCSWSTDACKVGATCTETCGVLNTAVTNTSYQTKCSTGVGLVASFCDVCIVQ